MARWQPNASERLTVAALDLFAERGYENTAVIDIAERAGLTKSTFFRHFQDKREVLFGGTAMADLLATAITGAPADAAPLEAVAHALDAVGRETFTPARREFTARRRTVIAAHPELQEREALKGIALIAAMTGALKRRGVPDLGAQVAAQVGALTLSIAYERWTCLDGSDGTAGSVGAADAAGSLGVADEASSLGVADEASSVGAADETGRTGTEEFGDIARQALRDVQAAFATSLR